MVTVFRGNGLRVVIFINDHPPAHVHVFGTEKPSSICSVLAARPNSSGPTA